MLLPRMVGVMGSRWCYLLAGVLLMTGCRAGVGDGDRVGGSSPRTGNDDPVRVRSSGGTRVTIVRGLISALSRATGDVTINLDPGRYDLGVGGTFAAAIRGKAGITLQASDPSRKPILTGRNIEIKGCDHLSLIDLKFQNIPHNGVHITIDSRADDSADWIPGHDILVEGCEFDNCGGGAVGDRKPLNWDCLKITWQNGVTVRNCVFAGGWVHQGSAIDAVSVYDLSIIGCTFANPNVGRRDRPDNAIQIKGGSRRTLVYGCTFNDPAGRLVHVGGLSWHPDIRNIWRPGDRDYRIEAWDTTVENNTFFGGLVSIQLAGSSGTRILNNRARGFSEPKWFRESPFAGQVVKDYKLEGNDVKRGK